MTETPPPPPSHHQEFVRYRNIREDGEDVFPFEKVLKCLTPCFERHFVHSIDELHLDDAFSIHYNTEQHDSSVGQHTDPSDITVNVCLGMSDDVGGSQVLFYGRKDISEAPLPPPGAEAGKGEEEMAVAEAEAPVSPVEIAADQPSPPPSPMLGRQLTSPNDDSEGQVANDAPAAVVVGGGATAEEMEYQNDAPPKPLLGRQLTSPNDRAGDPPVSALAEGAALAPDSSASSEARTDRPEEGSSGTGAGGAAADDNGAGGAGAGANAGEGVERFLVSSRKGWALVHLGSQPHQVTPITAGTRTNGKDKGKGRGKGGKG